MAGIPTAVSSAVKTPGFYLRVNLLGATASPGTAQERGLIIAPQNSSGGDITDDTEVRKIFGADDASISHGPGGQGHLMAQRLFEEYNLASVDIISPAESAGLAATITHVYVNSPTVNSVVRFDFAGRIVDVAWNAGESATVGRDRAVATINGFTDIIPAIASAGAGGGDLDVDAKSAGLWGNDITTGASFLSGGAGATITSGGSQLAGGTLEPDLTAALSAIQTTEYRVIVGGLSNTDAQTTGATSNGDRLRLHINAEETGLDALLQVGIIGHTGSTASMKAGAIDRNDEAMQYVGAPAFQSLPCELAAAEAGNTLEAINVRRANFNRIGNQYIGIFGPKDPVNDKLTFNEGEDLLTNGVTAITLAPITNDPQLLRPITAHSQQAGNPDFRAFDMSDTYGAYFVADDIRVNLPIEFKNTSIVEDLPAGADALPPGVVERKDVFEWVKSRMFIHARLGILDRGKLEESIQAGTLVVEIDDSDDTQVNIFIPASVIKPLAKFSGVVSKAA